MDEVTALAQDLTEASVTYDMELYDNVRHAFATWGTNDYEPQVDLKSWNKLLEFLSHIL